MRVLILMLFALTSCSLEIPVPLTLSIAEIHPFEELYGEDLWYELTYMDGESVRTEHVGKGIRDISVSVHSGGLCAFIMEPLGEFSPIGGFFEPGDDRTVYLTSSSGEMAELLISAFEYRPDAVLRLSMEKVKEICHDLPSIDPEAFLSCLFDGSLNAGTMRKRERRLIAFDTIPEGEWISERYEIPSFTVGMSGDEVLFDVYPGIYRYIEKERGLLLTVICTEDGEASATIKASPL